MMMSTSGKSSSTDVEFRPLLPSDIDEVRMLHDELFPVTYSDKFYSDLASGIGPRNHVVYSLIAVHREADQSDQSGKIIGFLFAQFEDISTCEDAESLFPYVDRPHRMMYILTLGVRRQYRRDGLGSKLLDMCMKAAAAEENCGGVFLHVISYNIPAIRFYERKQFLRVAELNDFYKIHGIDYNAYLYAFYANEYSPGLFVLIQDKLRKSTENILSIFSAWMMRLLPNYGPAVIHAPYMDDIVLHKKQNCERIVGESLPV